MIYCGRAATKFEVSLFGCGCVALRIRKTFIKLIDEKGRLFKKINIIDLLVVLFLVTLTPILYYGYNPNIA